MNVQQFQKQPQLVSAIQWDGTDDRADEIYEWTGQSVDLSTGGTAVSTQFVVLGEPDAEDILGETEDAYRRGEGFTAAIYVGKSGQWANLNTGDWIIAESDGSGHYPCAADVFNVTYRQVDERRGIDLEIVERCTDEESLAAVNRVGVIAPGDMRINGQDVLWPTAHPPVFHELSVGKDCAVVTLTLFARSVTIRAEK